MVTSDMAATLTFYRRLGLDIPAGSDDQPHVEATTPGGVRIAWDTEETVRSFAPDWTPRRAARGGSGWPSCATPPPRSTRSTAS